MNSRPCRFFLAGNCRNGADCRFFHDGFSTLPESIRSESTVASSTQSLEVTEARPSTTNSSTITSGRPHYAASRPCHWYLAGYCRRGDTCWFSHDRAYLDIRHRDEDTDTSGDGDSTGFPGDSQNDDEEDQKCAVCFEAPKTFGLLGETQVNKACPMCRTPSLYVVPSSYFPSCQEQKEIIIQNYKEATSRTPCRYFKDSGARRWCPFGDGCFFAHHDENGEPCKVIPRPPRPPRPPRRNRRTRESRLYWADYDFFSALEDALPVVSEDLQELLEEFSRVRTEITRWDNESAVSFHDFDDDDGLASFEAEDDFLHDYHVYYPSDDLLDSDDLRDYDED
ncbi:hypothetical protein BGZ50_005808 [Haplosporangium sp. Z 11]|nr:hypothetical protein BGZ50_005808 [Haplosporangium sp. Z 11]